MPQHRWNWSHFTKEVWHKRNMSNYLWSTQVIPSTGISWGLTARSRREERIVKMLSVVMYVLTHRETETRTETERQTDSWHRQNTIFKCRREKPRKMEIFFLKLVMKSNQPKDDAKFWKNRIVKVKEKERQWALDPLQYGAPLKPQGCLRGL